MLHYAAFHQGLHFLRWQMNLQRKKSFFFLNYNLLTLKYKLYNELSCFYICSFMEYNIGLKRVKAINLNKHTSLSIRNKNLVNGMNLHLLQSVLCIYIQKKEKKRAWARYWCTHRFQNLSAGCQSGNFKDHFDMSWLFPIRTVLSRKDDDLSQNII